MNSTSARSAVQTESSFPFIEAHVIVDWQLMLPLAVTALERARDTQLSLSLGATVDYFPLMHGNHSEPLNARSDSEASLRIIFV
jgi:hypothetical protein